MRVERLGPDDISLVATIDRSERVDVQYVSATPTGSAVGFYLGQGCRLADPGHSALFADEPEDIHLVYALR